MSIKGYKRLTCALSVLLLLAVIGCGMLIERAAMLEFRSGMAEEQTRIFEEMSLKARQTGGSGAVDYLAYAWRYYPSGSKQEKGSRLDRVVERARQSAAREIIAHLKMTTGKNYGDDPEAWLKAYGN